MGIHRKILIIGNSAEFRKELNQKLHKAGYEVFQAVEESALEILKDIKMDLVFLAQPGSEESQLEFFHKARRTYLGKDVALLLIPASEGEMNPVFKRDKCVDHLPSWPMKTDDVAVWIDRTANRGARQATKYKVLIAGTEDEVIDNMMQQLKKEEFEAQSAVSGAETITKAVQMLPDILILDALLDRVLAPDVIKILRQMPQFDKKPILVYCYYRISDLGREDVREKVLSIEVAALHCKEAGEHEYIGRYNENAFLKVINQYLF